MTKTSTKDIHCDNANTAVLVLDNTDTIRNVFSSENKALCNELHNQNIHELDHPINELASELCRVYEGQSITCVIELQDNLFEALMVPMFENGEYKGVTITCIPVSGGLAKREQYYHYQLLTEYTTDFIARYLPNGTCTYASPTLTKILGYEPHEIIGQPVFNFLHPDDLKSRRRLLAKLIEDNFEEPVSYRVRAKDGSYVWIETHSERLKNSQNSEIIAVSRDITKNKETEERLLYLANYDSLTGLPNRALFRDRLRRTISRAQRNKTQVALLFLDLDRFKNVNDSLGHHAGDQLLRGVAKRLKQFARKNDTIARLGGDEFTIILEDIHDPDDAAKVAGKILEIMTPPFTLDGHEVAASTSIGITVFPDDATDMRSLLKNADTAMYRSKDKGRNRYQFYTAGMNAKAYEHLILENALRHALEREEFRLYFQPQIDLHTQGVIGIEALVRWEHPEQGLILPEKFVPFAEENGLIHPIGEWVLNAACKEMLRWQAAGIPPIRVAINLSMRQFRQSSFVDMISDALETNGIDPNLLELEITESFLAHNVEHTTEILHRLRALGVKISVDDFGTGYSSLSYLKRFPLNTLKIDKSFVQDISTDPDGATIAEAIIALGQSLRLNVIAEGVESDEQVFFLRSRGCDRVQGFLFSHPLSSDEALAWLKRNRSRRILFEQHDLWPEAKRNYAVATPTIGV